MDTETRDQSIGAYEAKTRFSELIARAERGESFIVTKNGREVARIEPPQGQDRKKVRQAVEALRLFREAQGPPVSEKEAQRNYEEMKQELDAEDEERDAVDDEVALVQDFSERDAAHLDRARPSHDGVDLGHFQRCRQD